MHDDVLAHSVAELIGFAIADAAISGLLLLGHLALLKHTQAKAHGVLALIAALHAVAASLTIAGAAQATERTPGSPTGFVMSFLLIVHILSIAASVSSAALVVWLARVWITSMAAVMTPKMARMARNGMLFALALLVIAHAVLPFSIYFVMATGLEEGRASFYLSWALLILGVIVALSIVFWMLIGPHYVVEKHGEDVCRKSTEMGVVAVLAVLYFWSFPTGLAPPLIYQVRSPVLSTFDWLFLTVGLYPLAMMGAPPRETGRAYSATAQAPSSSHQPPQHSSYMRLGGHTMNNASMAPRAQLAVN